MISTVHVQIRRPSGDDPGQVTTGHYVVQDGLLIMTDARGLPVNRDDGTLFSHQMRAGDQAEAIARVLTRKVRRELLGMTETEEKFRRKIVYPQASIA